MNKYHAIKIKVDGITFDSKAEAARYAELKLLDATGDIEGLTCQPRYTLQEGFMCRGVRIRPVTYIADFSYVDTERRCFVVEDVKSPATKTEVFNIKRKMFLRLYGEKVELRIIGVDGK